VFEPSTLPLIVLGLPLLASLASSLCGIWPGCRQYAHLPTIVAFAVAAVFASILLGMMITGNHSQLLFHSVAWTWFHAGNVEVAFQLTADPLAAVMLATVTFVATWIALFSVGYMHDDPGYARYFALIGLFVFSMCLLVLANDLLLMVAGWEGVGLCSYLLVGYYYAKPTAAAAARKAFLVTRLGDAGMILGLFMLWQISGFQTSFDGIFRHLAESPPEPRTITLACLLLFCGAVGKSAQLPLYVWLPDAMEGPTPVSALIHAATMVTAGVYLLARMMPVFVLSPDALMLVAVIGGLTAIVAAFIAIGQHDLKRVLAYSTVSQLGYMFMGLGTAAMIAPNLAVIAAIFHLVTHAFFKALLFLAAGSVMHAMGNVIDLRKFSGLRVLMPVTHLTFLCGAAALAGIPLLSGFWSKDQIFDVLYQASLCDKPGAGTFRFVFVCSLITAAMTAFYTFRAYFLTFWGPLKTPPEAGDHPHESPRVMLWPLIVLAIGAVFLGIVVEPFTHYFSDFLSGTPWLQEANRIAGFNEFDRPHLDGLLAITGSILALAGVALAWYAYRDGTETVGSSLRSCQRLSQDKLYIDELYASAIVKPIEAIAMISRFFDGVIHGIARLISLVPRLLAEVLKPLQTGLVQFYALGMILGMAVFLTVVIVRTSG